MKIQNLIWTYKTDFFEKILEGFLGKGFYDWPSDWFLGPFNKCLFLKTWWRHPFQWGKRSICYIEEKTAEVTYCCDNRDQLLKSFNF